MNETKEYEIYEEGFIVPEGSDCARFIGIGRGKNFIEACRDFIKRAGFGEIKKDDKGNEYASAWGCRWFPTLREAQESFG